MIFQYDSVCRFLQPSGVPLALYLSLSVFFSQKQQYWRTGFIRFKGQIQILYALSTRVLGAYCLFKIRNMPSPKFIAVGFVLFMITDFNIYIILVCLYAYISTNWERNHWGCVSEVYVSHYRNPGQRFLGFNDFCK
ncbi:hypothetical protein SAMN05421747_10962 [Parapedobacter composti]|uniref:Uncharacterized protein n=1 Tax=Parapedobacter composti TaxID=623281 RepID=A0A1I1IHS5_9SPHI|nr:hypothetical protein SAMN05421747_10962 [Parapedobacter composti]